MDDESCLGAIVFCVALAFGAFAGGCHVEQSQWRTECVRRGLAHWEVNVEGEAVFTWNGPPPIVERPMPEKPQ